MSKNKAHINPEVLVWARTTLKLTVQFAAEKIGITEAILTNWEAGIEKLSISQLLKISEVYKRPFSLFFLPKPPKHFKPLKDFRRFADFIVTDKDEFLLQKEILAAQQNRNNALILADLLNEKLPEFTLRIKATDSPNEAAKRIIEFLKIEHHRVFTVSPGYPALNYWKRFFEDKGIMIYQSSGISMEVMRGSCIAETRLPVIIINSNDSENGRIFTLFHELVHIALREDGISNFRFHQKHLYDKIETYCNKVAAEILVPSDALSSHRIVLNHTNRPNWTEQELTQLGNHFCVSQEVILRRLLTLRKTNNDFFQQFRNSFSPKAKANTSGGDYYRNVIGKTGRLIINLALQNYYQEKITSSELYDYIHVKAGNLSKLENLMYAKV